MKIRERIYQVCSANGYADPNNPKIILTENEFKIKMNELLDQGVSYDKNYLTDELLRLAMLSPELIQNHPNFSDRGSVKNFVELYFEFKNKGREVELYDCKRPLKALNFLDDKGRKNFSDDVNWNPFYHAYLCVKTNVQEQKVPYCNGQTTENGLSGPGIPSNDEYAADKCDKLDEESVSVCIADCWDALLRSEERPYYEIIGDGINCQEYEEMILAKCKAACE